MCVHAARLKAVKHPRATFRILGPARTAALTAVEHSLTAAALSWRGQRREKRWPHGQCREAAAPRSRSASKPCTWRSSVRTWRTAGSGIELVPACMGTPRTGSLGNRVYARVRAAPLGPGRAWSPRWSPAEGVKGRREVCVAQPRCKHKQGEKAVGGVCVAQRSSAKTRARIRHPAPPDAPPSHLFCSSISQ
jgi:hypothetical protein